MAQDNYHRDPSYAEFFGFRYADKVFSFATGGETIVTRTLQWMEEASRPEDTKMKGMQLALPIFSGVPDDKVKMPLGLVGISGGTAVGKTTFVEALGTVCPVKRIIAGEPYDRNKDIGAVTAYAHADRALAEAIKSAMKHPKTFHVIDSLRGPLFETSGPAGKSGLILPFFTQLTRVSNTLAQAGLTIGFTINPMNEDPDFVATFLSKLSASLPAAILLNSITRTGEKVTSVDGTISRRPARAPTRFNFRPNEAVSEEGLATPFSFSVQVSIPETVLPSAPLVNSNQEVI